MIRVNGHITLSSKLKSTLNEGKLKQNTHLKQDLCSGFSRWCLNSCKTMVQVSGNLLLLFNQNEFRENLYMNF